MRLRKKRFRGRRCFAASTVLSFKNKRFTGVWIEMRSGTTGSNVLWKSGNRVLQIRFAIVLRKFDF